MALNLLDTNPFANSFMSFEMTDRAGFTFDPNDTKVEFDSWKREFERNTAALNNLTVPQALSGISSGVSNVSSGINAMGDILTSIKELGDKERKTGYAFKTIAAAGEFFSKALTASMEYRNADRKAKNKRASVENQMLELDNEILYNKNLIADKFGKTMARNAMTMAAKGLRVTAGNLLEQTKDEAYDATKDIETMESNAELKKIALRAEEKQANVSRHLAKQLLASDLIYSGSKLGLNVMGAYEAGVFD